MNATDTTWRDDATGLVHHVVLRDLQQHWHGLVADLFTDCGIKPSHVWPSGEGDVTCVLCLEGDWLRQVSEPLGTYVGRAMPVEPVAA